MTFSIIIPVFNGEQCIRYALDSILRQSYNKYEIIVVDDSSTDHSAQIVKCYCNQDNRIKLTHNKNKGVTSARLSGATAAQGEYIFFMDADDTLPHDALHDINTTLQQHPNCDIVIGDIIHVDGASRKLAQYGNHHINNGQELFNWIIDNRTGFLWGKLIKKDLFFSLSVVPTDMKFCEDLIQMLQLSYRAKEVRHCQAPTYEYYQTVNSACNTILTRKEYAYRFYLLCHYIALLSASNEYSEQAQSRLEAMFLYYGRLYLWVMGHWPKNDTCIKEQFKQYISKKNVMQDCILQGQRGVLTRLTAYFAPLFSIGYVFLLRHKYHRIK